MYLNDFNIPTFEIKQAITCTNRIFIINNILFDFILLWIIYNSSGCFHISPKITLNQKYNIAWFYPITDFRLFHKEFNCDTIVLKSISREKYTNCKFIVSDSSIGTACLGRYLISILRHI